jgi:cell wall-associated NlpC family hydrolase
MFRGGSRLVRRLLTLGLAVPTVAASLAFVPTQPAVAAGAQRIDISLGEAGSGPAPFPVEVRITSTARSTATRWSDLDATDAWARTAIRHVGGTNRWMRDFSANADGSYPFRPDVFETRKYLARAVVRAFSPALRDSPAIDFPDLATTQTFNRWASVAVKLGWMSRTSDGRFLPDKPVTMAAVHRVLVLALGMGATARDLDRLRTRDGFAFDTPKNFGTTMLGMRLGLRYNSSNEVQDVGPSSSMTRAQVAYSLYKATTLPSWVVPWVAGQYEGVTLPKMGPQRRALVQWGLRYVGYPYVWAGEWGFGSPAPSGLGGQPVPGFDCSGIVWWALRANDGGSWHVAPPRPYAGWSLPQRSSADMARIGTLKWGELKAGDLMFYDGDGNGSIDHVDVYVGNGYALDSSSSPGGVTLMWVGDGWYRDHFVHGRRLITF